MTDFSNVQPGQIFVTHISGRTGILIGAGEWLAGQRKDDKYSHAGICLGGSRIIEAEPNGARIGDLSEYDDGRPLAFSDISLAQGKGQEIADAALSLQGTPYSFLDYGAIALHSLHLPGLHSVAARETSMICSTLAVVSYKSVGIDLFPGLLPGYVMPNMVAVRIAARV